MEKKGFDYVSLFNTLSDIKAPRLHSVTLMSRVLILALNGCEQTELWKSRQWENCDKHSQLAKVYVDSYKESVYVSAFSEACQQLLRSCRGLLRHVGDLPGLWELRTIDWIWETKYDCTCWVCDFIHCLFNHSYFLELRKLLPVSKTEWIYTTASSFADLHLCFF